MRYAQHRSSKRASAISLKLSKKKIGAFLLLLVAAIILVVVLLPKAASKEPIVDDNVVVPEAAVLEAPSVEAVESGAATIQEIDLFFSGTRSVAGFARRGTEGELFTHVIVADLSAIDLSTTYYEAWLVKPGITDFFSTGEMFSREDGKFGLVWETSDVQSGLDIWGYSRVIITREQRDGNASPSATHVAEGDFEN